MTILISFFSRFQQKKKQISYSFISFFSISILFPIFPPLFPAFPPLFPTFPLGFLAFYPRFPSFLPSFPAFAPHSPHSVLRFPIPAFTDSLPISLLKSHSYKPFIKSCDTWMKLKCFYFLKVFSLKMFLFC